MTYKPVMNSTSEWSTEEIEEALCEYYYRQFMAGKKPKHPESHYASLTSYVPDLPSCPITPGEVFAEKKRHWRDAVYTPQSLLSA